MIPRATALAWMPTARHEPSAASVASEGFGAVSSPSSAGGRQTANEIEVPEAALRHRLAFQRLDDLRVGFALGNQLFQTLLVDGGKATGQGSLGDDFVHEFAPRQAIRAAKDTDRSVLAWGVPTFRSAENGRKSRGSFRKRRQQRRKSAQLEVIRGLRLPD